MTRVDIKWKHWQNNSNRCSQCSKCLLFQVPLAFTLSHRLRHSSVASPQTSRCQSGIATLKRGFHPTQRMQSTQDSIRKKVRNKRSLRYGTEFRQTFANVRQRRPWVLKISILTLNFPQIRVFQLQSLHFSTKNFWQEEDFPTAQNLGGSPSGHDATDCPQVWGCPLLPFMVSGAPVHGCLTSHANDESALPS